MTAAQLLLLPIACRPPQYRVSPAGAGWARQYEVIPCISKAYGRPQTGPYPSPSPSRVVSTFSSYLTFDFYCFATRSLPVSNIIDHAIAHFSAPFPACPSRLCRLRTRRSQPLERLLMRQRRNHESWRKRPRSSQLHPQRRRLRHSWRHLSQF